MKCWWISLFLIKSSLLIAAVTPLEVYLEQVKKGNDAYKAALAAAEGAALRGNEGSTVFAPTLFANGQLGVDRAPVLTPAFQGTEREQHTYQLGIAKAFDFGLQGKLSYGLSRTKLQGVNPTMVPTADFYDGKPLLELSQPLWRNFAGRELRASENALSAAARSERALEAYKMLLALAEAEAAYWRLALSRDAVAVQKTSVARAERIRDWSARRATRGLGDKSDLLQAEAALRLRQLEMQAVQNEERTASLHFNSLRGVTGAKVEEDLSHVKDFVAEKLAAPKRASSRADTLATQEAQKALQASALISIEKNKPNLELYTSAALNGRDAGLGTAFSNSLKTGQSTMAIGVKFSLPLNFGVRDEVAEGYQKAVVAADARTARKVFEQEKEWNDLQQKLSETLERLALVREIEATQEKKFLNERDRHTNGRSTTFLVLQFEQDLAGAQLNRLKTTVEALTLIAQMKTFGDIQ